MKKGFTLIELIFVIVIIGILGAVALPKFASIKANAKAKTIANVYNTFARNIPTQVMSAIELDALEANELNLKDYIEVPAGWVCKDGTGPNTNQATNDDNVSGMATNDSANLLTNNKMSGGVCGFDDKERAANGFMFKIGLNADMSEEGIRSLWFHLSANSTSDKRVPESAIKLYETLQRQAIGSADNNITHADGTKDAGPLSDINASFMLEDESAIRGALKKSGTNYGITYMFRQF